MVEDPARAGLIAMILGTIGVPVEGIGLILGVDRFMERRRQG